MYNLISSVYFYKNKLAIGKNNGTDLLVYLKNDLRIFKELTNYNIIIMGTNTFYSLPKLLKNRIHIVLTRNNALLKMTEKRNLKNIDNIDEGVFYLTVEDLFSIKTKKSQYVIGGEKIFNLFLKEYPEKINKVYFTQIKGYNKQIGEPDRFIDLKYFTDKYKLIGISELFKENDK